MIERTIFVGNLSYDATEAQVREAFAVAGFRAARIRLGVEQDGKSRGYAFVELLCDDVENVVRAMYGAEIHGRHVRVEVSTSKRSVIGYGPKSDEAA